MEISCREDFLGPGNIPGGRNRTRRLGLTREAGEPLALLYVKLGVLLQGRAGFIHSTLRHAEGEEAGEEGGAEEEGEWAEGGVDLVEQLLLLLPSAVATMAAEDWDRLRPAAMVRGPRPRHACPCGPPFCASAC
jgi:hypothetical protein